MLIDAAENFAKVTVSGTYNAAATAITLEGANGARLPDTDAEGPFNLVWFNSTDYKDPADDPNREIVRVLARATDALTILRAQEGTAATTKNAAGKVYKMVLAPTKKLVDDLQRYQLNNQLPFPLPKRFVFHDDLDSGWLDWYGAGTVAHDSSDKVLGTASLKITTLGNGTICGGERDIVGGDWSTKNFRIWVKADLWARVSQYDILISTGVTQFDNFFACNLKNLISAPVDGEWLELYLTRDNFITGAGTPNWTLVNDMIIRCIDTSGGIVTVHADGFGVFDEGSAGYVSVVFDDGWSDGLTQGKLKMDDYGFRGNYFVIPDLLGQSGRMTEAQVTAAARQGWEIGGHGDDNLTTLTERERDEHLQFVRQWLADRGYKGADLYAYPNGGYNDAVSDQLLKYFSGGRALAAGSNPGSAVNPRHISCRTVVNTDTTSTLQGEIDAAVTNKKWLILTFHKIVTTPSVDTEYSIANFGTVIDYLNTQSVSVLPMQEVLRRL